MVAKQTLCHVINGDKILLKRAVRGISVGKWNAPGGNIEGFETAEQCAIREVFEETGLRVKNLYEHGVMNFYLKGSEEVTASVTLFSTKDFDGELRSSIEGEVQWFDFESIPMSDMWEDDEYWLDLMLKNRKFDAEFHFDVNGKIVRYYVVFK